MEKNNVYEEIVQYLKGEMPPEDREQFKARMKADPELSKEVRYFWKAQHLMEISREDQLKSAVAGQAKEALHQSLPVRKLRAPRVWVAAAASFLLLLGITGFHAHSNYSDAALAAGSLFEPKTAATASDSDSEKIFRQGLQAFLTEEDYEKAARIFQQIQPAQQDYLTARNYLARCYFQMGDYEEAHSIYQTFLDQQITPPYSSQPEIEWHLLLTDLALGKEEQVQQKLQSYLQDEDHPLYNKAVRLNKKLNSFWRNLVWF